MSTIDLNFTPILSQLTLNHGATIALAKATLSKEQFELFLIESEIQAKYSFLDFVKMFPDSFKSEDNIEEILENQIAKLKKQRNELK